jgi:hypothetical protein
MLEPVRGVRRRTALKDQSRRRELAQSILYPLVPERGDAHQQLVGELPSDRRPDLCQLLGRAEPIEPRHQGSMQACRDRQRWGGNRGRDLHRLQLTPGLQHSLCHFFDEQWDAVGTLDNVLPDICRQRLAADDPVDHGANVALSKPIEDKSCDMRLSDPWRLELRPKRHNH